MFLTGPRWSKVARRNSLRPGQLLLFDNTAVVHGRLSQRQRREPWQMLLGLPVVWVHVARFVVLKVGFETGMLRRFSSLWDLLVRLRTRRSGRRARRAPFE